VFAKDGAVINF